MSQLGEKIKEARLYKDMTQAQLAKALGVPQNTLSQWENGRRQTPVEMIRPIAVALDCDPNYLLGFGE